MPFGFNKLKSKNARAHHRALAVTMNYVSSLSMDCKCGLLYTSIYIDVQGSRCLTSCWIPSVGF